MALSDAAIRTGKSAAKPFKLYDEGGLLLIGKPSSGTHGDGNTAWASYGAGDRRIALSPERRGR